MKGTFAENVTKICKEIETMLIEKNKAYGNSALEPVRIFSKVDCDEQIKVRIDDKLSRIAKGSAMGEDVINDLIGYLVILKISREEIKTLGFNPDTKASGFNLTK